MICCHEISSLKSEISRRLHFYFSALNPFYSKITDELYDEVSELVTKCFAIINVFLVICLPHSAHEGVLFYLNLESFYINFLQDLFIRNVFSFTFSIANLNFK